MTKTNLFILFSFFAFAMSSCKTYYIPVDNFKKAFEGMGPEDLTKEVTMRGPGNESFLYKTYPIDSIYCVDRKGSPVVLENTPKLKIEIIYFNKEKSVIHFQFLRVNNGVIGPIDITKELVYYDVLSPATTRLSGDTLSALESNRVRSSFYVYGNNPGGNRTREIPVSEIKKITVLQW